MPTNSGLVSRHGNVTPLRRTTDHDQGDPLAFFVGVRNAVLITGAAVAGLFFIAWLV